jgi:hypothetical protein
MTTALKVAETVLYRCKECGGIWIEGKMASATALDDFLSVALYAASVPERAARGAVNLAGGLASEIVRFLVPKSFQSGKTYEVLVKNSLAFLVNEVGKVGGEEAGHKELSPTTDEFLARKAVGNFVDLAGMATLHVSPLWVLAILSDLAYGSSAYLRELAQELRKQGLIDKDSTIEHAEDLLRSLNKASASSASLFDTPPLNVEGLKECLKTTKAAVDSMDVTKLVPQAELDRLMNEMKQIAKKENASVFEVSSTIAMYALSKLGALGKTAWTSAAVAGKLFDLVVIKHYASAVDEISRRGLFATLSDISSPYLKTVYENFSPARETVTEQLFKGTLLRKLSRKITQLFTGRSKKNSGAMQQRDDESGKEDPDQEPK